MVTSCFFLGNIAGAPELHISDEEAAEIGEALKELSKHYPIGMSEKTIAWVNLSFAVGGVFGPKVVAVMKRPGPQRANVTPIRGKPAAAPDTTVEASPGPQVPSTAVDPAGPSYSVVEPPEDDYLN